MSNDADFELFEMFTVEFGKCGQYNLWSIRPKGISKLRRENKKEIRSTHKERYEQLVKLYEDLESLELSPFDFRRESVAA